MGQTCGWIQRKMAGMRGSDQGQKEGKRKNAVFHGATGLDLKPREDRHSVARPFYCKSECGNET
jgi:hypothetical protein